jgi:RNA polymerase sigma factor (sigma-70 family)
MPNFARPKAVRLGHDTGAVDTRLVDLVPERLYKIARAGVRRALGDHPDSEDLVQEVLERVLRSLRMGQFAGNCTLSTWVTAIAQRVAQEELRTFARNGDRLRRSSRGRLDGATSFDLDHQLEARRVLDQVLRLLERMPPETARVVLLHDLLGHELAEVADLTHLSSTAAQSRLVRARRELLRKLGKPDRRAGHGGTRSERRPDCTCAETARNHGAKRAAADLKTNACSEGSVPTNEGRTPLRHPVATCR